MDELIELYLFKYRKCPLLELGTLEIVDSSAVASLAERMIYAPLISIRFVNTAMPADHFINFIANNKKVTKNAATLLLKEYCVTLRNMDAYGETKFLTAGKFYVNEDGQLVFKPADTPGEFLPVVYAERVIHTDASHSMTVGDKETTSAEMTAYYSENDLASRDKWWIPALIIFLIAAIAIGYFFNADPGANTFGNRQKIQIKPDSATYKPVE
ncbi:MAG: hypothetical protein ABIO04_01905 [Ferruginibacter sp.]